MTTPDAVRAALTGVLDPEIRKPITELDMVESIDVVGDHARINIALTVVGCPASDRIEADVRAAALSVAGITSAEIILGVMSPATRTAMIERIRGTREMPFGPGSLTRVIAVASGKGGVGKSTVTANLAVAIANAGLSVGLLDADVHGYSIPAILGIEGQQPTRVGEVMMPPQAFGVRVISIGMFVTDSQAISWRGPMLHRTLKQFLTDVYWGDLDILLIDMPPGTGDVAISLGQLLPDSEVLVVTTPQAAAAGVAERSAGVALQTGQSVLGVVENMTAMRMPDGTLLDLFGSGGGESTASRLGTTVLAQIPLDIALRESGDRGTPIASQAQSSASAVFQDLAKKVARRSQGLAGRSLPMRSSN
ncbi:Mrp/NBP35 family ATP-binding protein [Humidisolicoccus flavus]|uniref:Mrp/NBP35 family ATP-binding protein n=1 Tax=Humidisolicoccus flavus TaxID=3111414 RepID=UPI00324ADADA